MKYYEQDLFPTFDQHLAANDGKIEGVDVSPSRRFFGGEIVFEPTGTGRFRVTARDAEHRVLWGYIGSRETVNQLHCLVAVYTTLQNMLEDALQDKGFFVKPIEEPMAAAHRALGELEKTLQWLRNSLDVKKVSDATLQRASDIARIAYDAECQIRLEANHLKGMKARPE